MDDRRRTLAAISIIVGFFVLVIVVFGSLLSRRGVLSPVPEEPAIRITFITPTPTGAISTPTTSGTPQPSPRATAVPRPSTTPTLISSPSATPAP